MQSTIWVILIPERYPQKNRVGVCSPLPEILTLFQTKICDFPYPISELIKNLIHLLSDLTVKIITLFQTCLIISSLVAQTMSYCRPKWFKLTPISDQNRAAHTGHIKDYPSPPGPSIIISMFLMKITDLPISRIKESEVECSAMASGSCNLPQYCNCQRCNVSLHNYQYLAR